LLALRFDRVRANILRMSELIQASATLVWDAAKGYVIEKALAPGLDSIWAHAKRILFPRWDAAFSEVQRNIADAFESAREGDAQFIDRLRRSFDTGEADALVTRLLRDAAQATTDERMLMLAAAAAGLLTPALDSEMRSRVARVLEQLEPSDVIGLREASAACALDHDVRQISGPPEATRALEQAGCLFHAEGIGYRSSYEVTPLGTAVLRALQAWTPTAN